MFFVILQNPSNKERFALVQDGDQALSIFDSHEKAEEAAKCTLFGDHGYYEIFSLGDSQ